MKVLFVCLGNICRSPTAEGVMRGLVAEADLSDQIQVDSAGTAGWHIGDPPDRRSAAAAAERGIDLDGASRQVTSADFTEFDLLVAMDSSNHRDLLRLAPDDRVRAKVQLLREYADGPGRDVPDPYYGGENGFADVVDIVERNCRAMLDELRTGLTA